MKRLIIVSMIITAFVVIWSGCTNPEEQEGTSSIYGIVTDFDTGEPVKNANVRLRPSGETTLTGIDGFYMFQYLKSGKYSLYLSKVDYEDFDDEYIIELSEEKQVCRDIQMKKRVAIMRITDMDGEDLLDLDFGAELDDVTRIFNIFNDSDNSLQYEITTTADWITRPEDGTNGTIQAGETKGIVVVIDRSKLQHGDNTTTMYITSNNGNQQLTIKAKREDVTTLNATDVNNNYVVLNGRINNNIPYSEKGFFYGSNHNLNNKVIVDGNGTGTFSAQITEFSELTSGTVYYFKAYCIYNGIYLYGKEKTVGPYDLLPTFAFNGHIYKVAPSPSTNVDDYMSWHDANIYCQNLTAYGFSDWRMPSLNELKMMYQLRESIGGWLETYTSSSNSQCYHVYWSSDSESFNNFHYFVKWTTGSSDYNPLNNRGFDCQTNNNVCLVAHVRPIRLDH